LHGLRWFPSGVMILLMQLRGLSLPQIGLVATAQGLVVLALELPTGRLADALGRKPVLTTAWTVNLVALGLFALADSFALLFLAWALTRPLPGTGQRTVTTARSNGPDRPVISAIWAG
jgi:MFS family permease